MEVVLRLFGHRQETAGDGAALRMLVEERRQALDGAGRGFGVGIEQQEVSAGGYGRGAIHAGGVARVPGKPNQVRGGKALGGEIAAAVA